MRIIDRFCVTVAASVGLCGAALALGPAAMATPYVTGGGAACLEQQAGLAAPIAAAPVVLPGPIPVAPIVPFVPPIPPVVPPIPPVVPVVPIAGAGAGAGVASAPIVTAAGTGKGAPVNQMAAPAPEPVVLPGPTMPAAAELPAPGPIPAVLAGTTTAFPACGAAIGPAQ